MWHFSFSCTVGTKRNTIPVSKLLCYAKLLCLFGLWLRKASHKVNGIHRCLSSCRLSQQPENRKNLYPLWPYLLPFRTGPSGELVQLLLISLVSIWCNYFTPLFTIIICMHVFSIWNAWRCILLWSCILFTLSPYPCQKNNNYIDFLRFI